MSLSSDEDEAMSEPGELGDDVTPPADDPDKDATPTADPPDEDVVPIDDDATPTADIPIEPVDSAADPPDDDVDPPEEIADGDTVSIENPDVEDAEPEAP